MSALRWVEGQKLRFKDATDERFSTGDTVIVVGFGDGCVKVFAEDAEVYGLSEDELLGQFEPAPPVWSPQRIKRALEVQADVGELVQSPDDAFDGLDKIVAPAIAVVANSVGLSDDDARALMLAFGMTYASQVGRDLEDAIRGERFVTILVASAFGYLARMQEERDLTLDGGVAP